MEIKPTELRKGNLVIVNNILREENGLVHQIREVRDLDCQVYSQEKDSIYGQKYKFIEPIPLTEEWLKQLGFKYIEQNMYINGKQWLLQVTNEDICDNEIINRDGTWFDGIGTYTFEQDGRMIVNTLCRGNYVCNNVKYVHELQNLYFALTRKELIFKTPTE